MIQINLLPDVKTKYLVAQRKKRLVLVSSIVISGVALGILALQLGFVYGAQKVQLNHFNDEINKNKATLSKISDLDKILTVQNQLNGLSGLHEGKPVVSRLFTYLPQITPNDVQISELNLGFSDSTLNVKGTAKSLESINKFVDTLKFTKYTTDGGQTQTPAFTTVVLTSFGRTEKDASFDIGFSYDPAIFASDNTSVQLIVPKITSTRSETERPNALFKEQPVTAPQEGQ